MGVKGTIHDRISQLVMVYGEGKNTVFANLIGENEANIRGYRSGIVPKHPLLEKIVTYLDISADWLLTGKGDMLRDKQPTQTTESIIVYKSDPKDAKSIEDKTKIITLLEEKIRLLEEKLTAREMDLDIARSVDTSLTTGTKPTRK